MLRSPAPTTVLALPSFVFFCRARGEEFSNVFPRRHASNCASPTPRRGALDSWCQYIHTTKNKTTAPWTIHSRSININSAHRITRKMAQQTASRSFFREFFFFFEYTHTKNGDFSKTFRRFFFFSYFQKNACATAREGRNLKFLGLLLNWRAPSIFHPHLKSDFYFCMKKKNEGAPRRRIPKLHAGEITNSIVEVHHFFFCGISSRLTLRGALYPTQNRISGRK